MAAQDSLKNIFRLVDASKFIKGMIDEPIAGLKECLLFAWREYLGVCLSDSHPGFLSPHAQLPGFLEAGSSSRTLSSTVIAFQADMMIHAPVILLASL